MEKAVKTYSTYGIVKSTLRSYLSSTMQPLCSYLFSRHAGTQIATWKAMSTYCITCLLTLDPNLVGVGTCVTILGVMKFFMDRLKHSNSKLKSLSKDITHVLRGADYAEPSELHKPD